MNLTTEITSIAFNHDAQMMAISSSKKKDAFRMVSMGDEGAEVRQRVMLNSIAFRLSSSTCHPRRHSQIGRLHRHHSELSRVRTFRQGASMSPWGIREARSCCIASSTTNRLAPRRVKCHGPSTCIHRSSWGCLFFVIRRRYKIMDSGTGSYRLPDQQGSRQRVLVILRFARPVRPITPASKGVVIVRTVLRTVSRRLMCQRCGSIIKTTMAHGLFSTHCAVVAKDLFAGQIRFTQLQHVGRLGEQRRVSVLRWTGRVFPVRHRRVASESGTVFHVVSAATEHARASRCLASRGGFVALKLLLECGDLMLELFFPPHLGLDQGF